MGFCGQCGASMKDDDGFCGECGASLDNADTSPVEAPQPWQAAPPEPAASFQPTARSQALAARKDEQGMGLRSLLLSLLAMMFPALCAPFVADKIMSPMGVLAICIDFMFIGSALWYGNRARKIPSQRVLGWIGFILALLQAFPIFVGLLVMAVMLIISLFQ
ncbi:MAG: zinc ribbon domain-containing protein [Candidatus Eremiobacteraeota bacterium]|nr:zinc ribbon domain-containing protein [Candidatus Eremiobacteraeota bacterium]